MLDVVREVLGEIQIDPASDPSNPTGATWACYYLPERDGLALPWLGKVFCNPPYGKTTGASAWMQKFDREYQHGNMEEGILLVGANTDTVAFQDLLRKYPVCFWKGRIQFIPPPGEAPSSNRNSRGSAFFYAGKKSDVFQKIFSKHGSVLTQYYLQ